MVSQSVFSAEKQVADLVGEDRIRYDQFRRLLNGGQPEEFYAFTQDYEKELKTKGYMMLYYKLKTNEGFFALGHRQLFRAMQYAEELDKEVREAGASDYFYLATGLFAEIYNHSLDSRKAEKFYMQTLNEVGDRDPKFTMQMYLSLAKLLSMRNSEKALQWLDKSIAMSQKLKNMDFLSLSLGMKAYVFLLQKDDKQFYQVYDEYMDLRSQDHPDFNHRYDNIVAVAKYAFDGEYEQAFDKIHEGRLVVDSSLIVVCVNVMKGDMLNGYSSMKRLYVEMDSIYGLAQSANFDQMATETSLMRSQEEATSNKRLAKSLVNWLIGMTVVFLFVYVMGRRRLMKKIWARSKELKKALSRAEESDNLKSAFIRNMSHEIRTPLNAVAGFSQVLCNPEYQLSDEEKKDMQGRITESVDQITSIVNELLELSRSESEQVMTNVLMTDVRCNDLCRSVMDTMKGRGKAIVEMRFSTNVDDDFTIRSNAYRLKSTLCHLIDNAQKFTDMGYIDLRIENKGRQVLFSITDTGIGIDEKDRDRIFETFSKLNEFREGIGLGLPISRRLVTSLGGTIELDPVYTGGCRFVITLPVCGG